MYETKILQLDLKGIAQSGQCFRMWETPDGVQLVAKGKFLQVWDLGQDMFRFSCSQEEYETLWKEYFDLNTDYSQYQACILKKDRFLQQAAAYRRLIVCTKKKADILTARHLGRLYIQDE